MEAAASVPPSPIGLVLSDTVSLSPFSLGVCSLDCIGLLAVGVVGSLAATFFVVFSDWVVDCSADLGLLKTT